MTSAKETSEAMALKESSFTHMHQPPKSTVVTHSYIPADGKDELSPQQKANKHTKSSGAQKRNPHSKKTFCKTSEYSQRYERRTMKQDQYGIKKEHSRTTLTKQTDKQKTNNSGNKKKTESTHLKLNGRVGR